MLWERLPDPNIAQDEAVVRHLTAGPGGEIYLMVADRHSVAIYRR